MKFNIFKKICWWAVLVPFNILITIIAYPLVPLIVLVTNTAGESPKWCWAWLTYDNSIDGDGGHLDRWRAYVEKYPVWGMYCRRVGWLWRNKGYNFAYYVCGAEANGDIFYSGNPRTESGKPGVPGVLYAWTPDGYWQIFAFIPWTKKRALRVYLGWKLKAKVDNPAEPLRAMMATHVNPFRNYID